MSGNNLSIRSRETTFLAVVAGREEALSAMQHDNVAVRSAAHLHVNELTSHPLESATSPSGIWHQPGNVISERYLLL